jgi:hypothetical protein
MRTTLLALSMLVMILPSLCILVGSVDAGHELAKPYGMNTPPSLFKNSTQRGVAPGALFRGAVQNPNGSILPSLSPIEWLEIAAVVLVVLVSFLAVRKKPPPESMHLERS